MDEAKIKELLSLAGVEVNGTNPWDIVIKNPKTYDRVLRDGTLGLGEAYIDEWWTAEKPDEFFYRVLLRRLDKEIKITPSLVWQVIRRKAFNRQSKSKAFQIGERHYDVGNDLFELMLGKTMAYSCGYWANAKNLNEAQTAKYDLVCRKMGLKKGMSILDIGCGFGTFVKYVVENYGVKAVGLTVSKEQAEWARAACAGLPIEIRLEDYRDIMETFDRVVSIGMFEHVGYKNYRPFMNVVRRCLKDGGLFLLHTIGSNVSTTVTDPWTDKYIFPGGQLPSIKQIGRAIEKIFVMEDLHNFGADYDKTLMAWHKNFEKNWPKIKDKYGERFHRMWKYYLLSCAGSFRARNIQLWQIVLSKNGVPGGWKSVR